MDIDGVYYCSRCMRKLDQEEQICPHCGYDAASAQVSSQHLEEGTFLNDRYLLGAVIGAGGFGVTYAAWDENLSVPVAIKEYFPVKYAHRNVAESDEILPHEEGRAPFALGLSRFRREAQVLAQFQNVPGIVNINECFDENGTAYIAMEFVHGVPLDVYVRERKPTPRKLLEIMLPAINALETIHRQGVNHRDVKPENLLVQEDVSIKLIDFGSAREVEHVTNLIIVSDGYAALEQYDLNQPQGPWVDVYGISATIYHMLTGVMPDAAISRAKHDKLKKPTRLGVRLKKYQEDALMAGLAVDPQKRIQSIAEFRSRLYNMPLPEEVRRRKAFVRRVIAVAVLTLLLMAAAFVNFAIGFPLGEGLIYSLYPDGWHVVGMAEEQAEVTVPADRLGLPVTVIGKDAFRGSQILESVLILERTYVWQHEWKGKGVRTIEDGAFAYCVKLKKVVISTDLASIGNGAFTYCTNLSYINIPNSVTFIGNEAFNACYNLWRVQFASGGFDEIAACLDTIGDRAFANCHALTDCILPDSVKYIGAYAFFNCYSMEKIAIPASVISVGDYVFYECSALNSITFLGNTLDIGQGAFDNCSDQLILKFAGGGEYFTHAEGLTSIEDWPLYAYRHVMTDIVLPEGITNISNGAFNNCNRLESIVIPDSVTYIGDESFQHCHNLSNVVIPDSVTSIGESAFRGCANLASITLPNSLTRIGNWAFAECTALTGVTIPGNVKELGENTFYDCDALTSITLSDGVTTISDRAFSNCTSLTSIIFPESVTTIGRCAFSSCAASSITIPDSIASFEGNPFATCPQLTSLVVSSDHPTMATKNGILFDKQEKSLLIYPSGLTAESYTIPQGIEIIGEHAFSSNQHLRKIELPNSVTSIGDWAFSDCSSLTSIALPDGVTSIGYGVFYGCEILTSITIPDSVTSIDDVAFALCTSLRSIAIPSNVTDIGNDAFWGCPSYLLFQVERDSYAAQYCQDNNLQYVYTDEQLEAQ